MVEEDPTEPEKIRALRALNGDAKVSSEMFPTWVRVEALAEGRFIHHQAGCPICLTFPQPQGLVCMVGAVLLGEGVWREWVVIPGENSR